MAKKITYEQMIVLANNILHPAETGLTEDEVGEQLFLFCINCPNPISAMDWVVVEAKSPITAEELVDTALTQTPRDIASVPESELPLTYPFRRMELPADA